MNYDLNYFIEKVRAIPKNKFTKYVYRDSFDYSKRCFVGHFLTDELIDKLMDSLDYEKMEYKYRIKEHCELAALCALFNPDKNTALIIMYAINNGTDGRYPQPTPKQRILAALYDIKKLQEPKPQVKEIIRYVAVDKEIRKEAKQLVVNTIDN